MAGLAFCRLHVCYHVGTEGMSGPEYGFEFANEDTSSRARDVARLFPMARNEV